MLKESRFIRNFFTLFDMGFPVIQRGQLGPGNDPGLRIGLPHLEPQIQVD